MSVRLALYQPEIPQNTGAVLRTAACLGLPLDLIGPCGFDASDRAFRRAGMDYIARATVSRHVSWTAFEAAIRAPIQGPSRRSRLVLLTTRADTPHTDFAFEDGDILLFGRESAGVPEEVHGRADARLRIPIAAGTRSLNLAASVAIVSAAALSHLNAWPMIPGP